MCPRNVLYCMCEAPPVSPNYRMSITLGLKAESAYGGGIQSIGYRPSTPLLLSRVGGGALDGHWRVIRR